MSRPNRFCNLPPAPPVDSASQLPQREDPMSRSPLALPDVQDRLRAEIDRSWVNSPLAAWMTRHQDDFGDLLRRGLSWDDAVQRFRAAGLTDACGGTPTPASAAETWRRIASLRQGKAA
jgi:hypothetical protein